MIKSIRIHGRGGQGNVTASEFLAEAAFEDGLFALEHVVAAHTGVIAE